ncbi:hypothetical protein [Dyella lutea]|uniref:Bacteriophage Rz lysis protein n=1 Tax=Dyella lutea TaxID=2950441 RepID=A0ABT1FF94_9GAMM|nr:hypothetical protein [Dyella lutea]MCP1376031.1 hypothetical protein [Dyella lutea]
MFGSLQLKLIVALVLALGLSGAGFWLHHSGVVSGRAEVQARWDEAKDQQAAVVAKADASNAEQTLTWTKQFAAAASVYEGVNHEKPPSVADSVAAGVARGDLRLRDEPAAGCPGSVPAATARSRAADAAAAAAATQRLADSVAAVRVGDACDIRDRQQSAQIVGLQEILRAERAGP